MSSSRHASEPLTRPETSIEIGVLPRSSRWRQLSIQNRPETQVRESARCSHRTDCTVLLEHLSGPTGACHSFQELPQVPTNMLQIEQKRVMPEQTYIFTKLYMCHAFVASGFQRICNFSLLPGWEQNVARHSHD